MRSTIAIIVVFLLTRCSDNKIEKHVESKYHCLLDSITNKDTMYIVSEYRGCFDHGKKTIKIFKELEKLQSSFSTRHLDSNYYFSAYLKDSSILAYRELENSIKENKDNTGWCTTTSTISISVKTDTIKYIDKSCHFDSYSNFIRKHMIYQNQNKIYC